MLKVKRETHSQRCEVCHQTDMFDVETESCLRCAQIALKSDSSSVNSAKTKQARFIDVNPIDDPPAWLWPISQAIKGGLLGGLSSGLIFGCFAFSTAASLSSRIDWSTIFLVLLATLIVGIGTAIIGVIIAVIVGLIDLIIKTKEQVALGVIFGAMICGGIGTWIFNQSLGMHTSDRDFGVDFVFTFLSPLIIGIIIGGWAGLNLHRARSLRISHEEHEV